MATDWWVMSHESKVIALIECGVAVDENDAEAQLEDMGESE